MKPAREDQSRNGVRVIVHRNENGSTVEADCGCFGAPNRLHTNPCCPVLIAARNRPSYTIDPAEYPHHGGRSGMTDTRPQLQFSGDVTLEHGGGWFNAFQMGTIAVRAEWPDGTVKFRMLSRGLLIDRPDYPSADEAKELHATLAAQEEAVFIEGASGSDLQPRPTTTPPGEAR
jgi:hypothetical protein